MDLSSVLSFGSRHLRHWRIEGFSADYYNALYVTFLADNPGSQHPPYHLLCVLKDDDEALDTLFAASYPETGQTTVHQQTIESLAGSIASRLEAWSRRRNLSSILETLTLGSRFHLEFDTTGEDAGVWLCPNTELERRYLSLSRLQQLWEPLSLEMPPTLRLEELRAVRRLHDSVSVVLLPDGTQAVFKGAVRVVARLYHELRELLRLPSHPNLISRPSFIVTRQVPNRHETIVCGFILQYHTGGSLLNRLKDCAALDEEPQAWDESPINPAHMPKGIFYSNPQSGYFKQFAHATDPERQMMENYSLAKVMWCIFEEQTNSKIYLDVDGLPGAHCVFPKFDKTPWRMRYWIWLCTRVSAEWGDAACTCRAEEAPVCGMTGARMQQGREVGPGLLETWKYLQATFNLEQG
ncbi:hypothetical protein J7337_012047 [Fusarium musae]|uniref:Uncharacterized protein n=1 Tax=Fusarium musae TaxID=1042133 RepID=A0A9P8D8E9_9HYPO|nr:hypothetical protein J7337_012047 [Fusarium musae]KAG9497253.1 hypothetical protein J7337_012047 [Fusarium musae]